MGLDMYLEREYYLYSWDKLKEKEFHITRADRTKGSVEITIPLDKVKRLILMEHQWRKSNAIHKWFVDNVQNGNDDCGRYYVSLEKIQELKETLEKVLALRYENISTEELEKKCEELLPTQAGFFFGNTNYSEDYFGDIMDTLNTLDRLLAEKDCEGTLYYSSSW